MTTVRTDSGYGAWRHALVRDDQVIDRYRSETVAWSARARLERGAAVSPHAPLGCRVA